MDDQNYIEIEIICQQYKVEYKIIDELERAGLIETERKENIRHLHTDAIARFEKILRLRQELGVNTEGIDIILNLLDRIENMEKELIGHRNRLSIYE